MFKGGCCVRKWCAKRTLGLLRYPQVSNLAPPAAHYLESTIQDAKWQEHASDTINVLVFVKDNAVVAYTEHPRNKGDFSQVKPECVMRDSAKFERGSGEDGWVYLKVRA